MYKIELVLIHVKEIKLYFQWFALKIEMIL